MQNKLTTDLSWFVLRDDQLRTLFGSVLQTFANWFFFLHLLKLLQIAGYTLLELELLL